MTGNTAKCDSTTTSNSSVNKFFNLLNSKSALDLIRHKKCQQITNQSNNQLRRSFKLLKAHRSESNLPSNHSQFNPIIQSSTNNRLDFSQLNTKSQPPKLTKPTSTGSLCDLKMKSNSLTNEPNLLTTTQIANAIADNLENIGNHNSIAENESPPPTPPIRSSSINSSLRPITNHHNSSSILPAYPNYNRELPNLPINEDKRKSISFSRLSPISDDGGFNSFDFTSANKRNVNVLNNRNLNNQPINYRNNNLINHNQHQTNNQLANNFDKWNNLTQNSFDNSHHHHNFQEPSSNLFTNSQRNSYFSDVSDQNLDLDYQNINSNNYQKSDNWSSSTSVLSTYTGITSSSTSDYYTASSETITNSPSLSSLNSAGLCNSSINTCHSPLIGKSKVSNLTKLYSDQSSLVNNLQNNNGNKNLSYAKHQHQQFPYTGSHSNNLQSVAPKLGAKLAKSPLPNTGIAISSLVEKPKRQESASVLYYIVAKDSSTTSIANNDLNNKDSQQIVSDKENQLIKANINNKSYFSEQISNKNSLNYQQQQLQNQQPQHNQSDLKAIQKSLHEFYLRHRNNSKDSQIQLENSQQSRSSNSLLNNNNNNNSAFHSNLTNYSVKSNDSIGSNSSSSSNSPTLFSSNNHNNNLPMIPLPAKPCFLNKTRTAEEEQKLNKLKAEAIYTNIHFNLLNDLKEDEFNRSSNRLSFRERCSPFENNSPNNKSNIENMTKNELRNFKNQPNNVKNIAKQFDGLSNCDLNANRVSPVSLNKSNNRSIPNGNEYNNLIVPTSKDFNFNKSENNSSFILNDQELKKSNDDEKLDDNDLSLENQQLDNTIINRKENGIETNDRQEKEEEEEFKSQEEEDEEEEHQLTEEEYKLKILENDNQIKLLLDYLRKNEMPKIEYNKIVLHIEEVDKVTKLVISLTNRLHKIESILQLRNQQHNNDTNDHSDLNDKFKQSTSTDSLLNDDKNNLFSSILSLSSISLNNLNFNGAAFSTSIEMLNSKKNKILDQIDEAMQLKQMIERRCSNLNNKIICKYLEKLIQEDNSEFNRLKQFNFVDSMRDKYELSIKFKELDQNARLDK